jgi:hypothetical protein
MYRKFNRPDSSAFASNRHVVSEAKYFILPVEVKALGMTVSKFGITAKELVCEFAHWSLASTFIC